MKNKKYYLFCLLFVFACSEKRAVLVINGWESYQNPYTNLSLTHPKDWTIENDGINLYFYSSKEAMLKFIDHTSKGPDGARLVLRVIKPDTLVSVEKYGQTVMGDLGGSGYEVGALEPVTIDSLQSFKLTYSGYYSKDLKIQGIQAFAFRDSTYYTLMFEAYNEIFEQTKMVFDTALASLILPEPKAAKVETDPSIPTATLWKYSDKYLTMMLPDNFAAKTIPAKAPVEFSVEIKGYRLDCFIRVDVIPAQGLSAEKVLEQNEKRYNTKSRGTAVIDGISTAYLNYSPTKTVESRVYFLVKNDKFFRVIMNYYKAMQKDFLPAFEKSIGSISVL